MPSSRCAVDVWFRASFLRPGVLGCLAFFVGINGIQVLAAACLALNQRGEGSSPSGPIDFLDVGKLGLIRRRRKPEIAGSNPAIQIAPWRTSGVVVTLSR